MNVRDSQSSPSSLLVCFLSFSFLFIFNHHHHVINIGGNSHCSSANDKSISARAAGDLLVVGRTARIIRIPASGSTTVELDTVTSAGDTVSLASALAS